MTSTNNIYGIEDDPLLGQFVAYYPSNRLRLLILAGAILLVVWFVTTVVLWQVEAGLASIITVIILAIAALTVGWFMMHLWNRSVVLFSRGFSYREGSTTAFIPFTSVHTLRLQAERRSYFGGWVRFNIYQLEILTDEDEQVKLNGFYNRIEELSLRLETRITQVQLTEAQQQLESGGDIRFDERMSMNAEGIHQGDDRLFWTEFGGHRVQNGQIEILNQDGNVWAALPLMTTPNVRLLTELLRQHGPDRTTPKANTL